MAEYLTNTAELTSVANAIRAKGKTSSQLVYPEGFVSAIQAIQTGDNYSLQTKSVTPTKEQQSVAPDQGYYGLSSVTVGAIPEKYQDVSGVTATAAHVLDGDKFVDATGTVVTGTMANNGAVSKTMDGLTTTSVTIEAGYTTGGSVSLTNDIEMALAAI